MLCKYAGNTALYINVLVIFNGRFILYFDIKISIFLALLVPGYQIQPVANFSDLIILSLTVTRRLCMYVKRYALQKEPSTN